MTERNLLDCEIVTALNQRSAAQTEQEEKKMDHLDDLVLIA